MPHVDHCNDGWPLVMVRLYKIIKQPSSLTIPALALNLQHVWDTFTLEGQPTDHPIKLPSHDQCVLIGLKSINKHLCIYCLFIDILWIRVLFSTIALKLINLVVSLWSPHHLYTILAQRGVSSTLYFHQIILCLTVLSVRNKKLSFSEASSSPTHLNFSPSRLTLTERRSSLQFNCLVCPVTQFRF